MNESDRLTAALEGRYTIERELGAGGMATVYLAHDVRHDRKVALKVLRPELAAILGGERFLKEIRTTANLQHPHILSLFDSGEADGLVFYVMPYVEGESLRDRLMREKQLPVEDAVRITREVASALDYAHRHGVVHRDIKPENILLHEGQALVADFGIALAASRSEGGTRMTETGMSLGTPHYMSPEQAMGEREITPKADVYALGCVLYEMLTGEPPFTGPTAQAIVARVMTEEPRSLTLQRRTVPPNVEAAAMTALAKLPADRFGSAAQFAEALGNPSFTAAGPARMATGPSRTAARARPSPAQLAAAIGVLAVLAAGAFLAGRRVSGDRSPLAMQIVPGPDHRLGAPYGSNIALSQDGRTLLYVAQGPSGRQLYVRPLGSFTSAPIAGTQNVWSDPAFSPDGRSVVYSGADGGVYRVSVTGGQAMLVNAAGICCTLAWTESGVLFSTLQGIQLAPPSGGTPRALGRIGLPGPTAIALPGGKTLLYLTSGSTHHVEALDVASGRSTRIEGLPDGVDDLAWTDGYLLFQVGTTLEAVSFDARGLRSHGEPVTLVAGVRLGASGGVRESQSSVTGTDLAFVPASGINRLALVDRDGRETVIADTSGSFHRPRFSPDGRRISVDITREQGRDVWVYDLDQRTMSRITFQVNGHDAIWADGRTLIYAASASDSSLGMYSRHIDGSAEVDTILEAPLLDAPEALTRDGQEVLAYSQTPTTAVDAWMVARTGRAHRVLMGAPYSESHLSLSRDGRWLAFQSDESGRPEVYVRALEGGPRLQVSTAGGHEPLWAPNGGELFYRTQSDKGARLISARVSFAPLRVMARDTLFAITDYEEADPHSNYDISPDGRRFVFIRQEMPNEIRVIRNWKALLKGR